MKAAVQNVETAIKKLGQRLPTSNIDTPMNMTYVPELDITEELTTNDVTFFQELVCILLQWATEIGRVDILL